MEQREGRLPEIDQRTSTIDAGLYNLAVAFQMIMDKFPQAFVQNMPTTPEVIAPVIPLELPKETLTSVTESDDFLRDATQNVDAAFAESNQRRPVVEEADVPEAA